MFRNTRSALPGYGLRDVQEPYRVQSDGCSREYIHGSVNRDKLASEPPPTDPCHDTSAQGCDLIADNEMRLNQAPERKDR